MVDSLIVERFRCSRSRVFPPGPVEELQQWRPKK